jgi:hypothetical protein
MMRRGETIEEWRERMMARAEELRRFTLQDDAARQSQIDSRGRPKRVAATSKPRKPASAPKPRTPRSTLTKAERKRRDYEPKGRPRAFPDTCVRCKDPVRRKSEPADGRKLMIGRGLCSKCYRQVRTRERGGPKIREMSFTHCQGCGVPFRKRGLPQDGTTRVHVGHGRCSTCRKRGL